MGYLEAVNLITTMSGILLVGIFFGYGHFLQLRKYTLEMRRGSHHAAVDYEELEKASMNSLNASIIFFLLAIALGIAIITLEDFGPNNILMVTHYGLFLLGCFSLLDFVTNIGLIKRIFR